MTADKAAIRKRLADLVKPLVDAHGGVRAVSRTVGRDASTISRWQQGDVPYEGLERLASSLRVDIRLDFPAHGHARAETKEPPPVWAGEVAGMVAAKVVELLRSDADARRLVAGYELEDTEPAGGDDPPEEGSTAGNPPRPPRPQAGR